MSTFSAMAQAQKAAAPGQYYNTVKQKLKEGKQVVGITISEFEPEAYCASANSGFDFLWIEMQHSDLTYSETARMIASCPHSSAIPFIRVPDATEGDIQKATDIGALGIILPMVDTVEKARNAVQFAKYPPTGRRSQGGGQYRELWGDSYRQTANDNIMVVAMIENPAGVDMVEKIAAVPGIDVIFAASTDLASFSGFKQREPKYEALVTRIHDSTLKAGLVLAGPLAWKDQAERPDFRFFQGPGPAALIRMGATAALGKAPGGQRPERGVAATEGLEPKK
jgi:2-keto-3-deoxy-L-rhamnonate aldolase RhmA